MSGCGSTRHLPTVAAPVGDDLRCNDTDRQTAIDHARQACIEGRISLDEYAQRLEVILPARTHGELSAVLHDLPRAPIAPTVTGRWRPYIVVMLILVGVWATTTPLGYFWPIWPALGWGIPLLLHRRHPAPAPHR